MIEKAIQKCFLDKLHNVVRISKIFGTQVCQKVLTIENKFLTYVASKVGHVTLTYFVCYVD